MNLHELDEQKVGRSQFEDFSWDLRKDVEKKSWMLFLNKTIRPVSLFFLTTLLVGVWFFMDSRIERQSYVLLELRVLDQRGYTVSGASVAINQQFDGKTDSFGEWRNFVKADPGSTVKVEVAKMRSQGEIYGEKQVVVPQRIPDDKTLEIPVSIKLIPRDVVIPRGNKVTPTKKSLSLDQGSFGEVSLKLTASGSGVSRTLYNKVEKKILPHLSKKLSKQGIKIAQRATWQIVLRAVPLSQKKGMLRVDVFWENRAGKVLTSSFITGLQSNGHLIARRIFRLTKIHLPKTYRAYREDGEWYVLQPPSHLRMWALSGRDFVSDAEGKTYPLVEVDGTKHVRMQVLSSGHNLCRGMSKQCFVKSRTVADSPLRSSQSRLTMELAGIVPKGAQVYVSGILSEKVGNNSYRYWGTPGTRSQVTVLVGSKIVHRQKVSNSRTSIPRLALNAGATIMF